MQSAKEKISNIASAAKEHLTICKAKVEEKVEKTAARTPEEKDMARERRKAKEAQAKMEFHQAKARHAAEKLTAGQSHVLPGHHHRRPPVVGANETVIGAGHTDQPVGNVATMAGTNVPRYPLGGHPPMDHYK